MDQFGHTDITVYTALPTDSERSIPRIQLLPAGSCTESVLRLRLAMLEAEIARHKRLEDFAERIDVDHRLWIEQKSELKGLRTSISILVLLVAGCLLLLAAVLFAILFSRV